MYAILHNQFEIEFGLQIAKQDVTLIHHISLFSPRKMVVLLWVSVVYIAPME